ncbi:hypothetical protein GCM10009839_43470 [Catenulispora yoronensis]|uniref:DUF7507 domain-containing protein n=1 Tax=Catenulispora yoronensis TaxID=450799 RepID=A0ABP5G228_9ACTN
MTPRAGLNLAVTCPADILVPGARMTCTSAPYTVTEADIRAGSIGDQAVVVGRAPTPPGGSVEAHSNRLVLPVRATLPGTGATHLLDQAEAACAAVVLGLAMIAAARRRHAGRAG